MACVLRSLNAVGRLPCPNPTLKNSLSTEEMISRQRLDRLVEYVMTDGRGREYGTKEDLAKAAKISTQIHNLRSGTLT